MMQENQKTALKRTLVGKVVSNKMEKTVTVLIERKSGVQDEGLDGDEVDR